MKQIRLFYTLFILILLLVTANPFLIFAQKPVIENGTLDLSQYDFKKSPPVSLTGIWEFYPNEFLQPNDPASFTKHQKISITVPKLWDKFVFDQSKNPNIGFGTYKLDIILPPHIGELALRMKRIESSYAVFVNGDMVSQVGKPGNSEQSAVPSQKTCSQFFSVDTNRITLLIHVSNFQHRKGGIDDPVYLGLPEQIVDISDRAKFYEWFMIGVILIMAVFYLGLWLYNYKKYSSLFFGLMLLSEILSIITNGEVILTSFFPDLSWALLKKLDYISNFMRITFFAWFFYSLYSKNIYKTVVLFLTGVNILMSAVVMVTELHFYSFTLSIFIILSAFTILYVIYAQIKSILSRRQGALIPFIGTLILFLTAVNDILFVSDIIQTTYLIPFGLFIFIFAQSYLLSFEFSNLYKKEDELNMFVTETDHTKNLLLNITGFNSTEILKIINEKVNADRSILFAIDGGYLKTQVVYPNLENEQKISCYRPPVDEAFSTMQPVLINQFNQNQMVEYRIKSLLCCPLMKGEKISGVLYLENTEKKNAFNIQTSEFIGNLSDQIIGLHENITFYKALENINLNLEDIIKKRTKDIRNQQDLLEEQKDEIKTINNQLSENLKDITEKNKIITENINFAKIIQRAGLPTDEYVSELFPDNFILFKPKEVIGGDFYWAKHIQVNDSEDLRFFAIADCTGHGVPGTLMAVIGNYLLNNAVAKKIFNPASILDNLQKNINFIFSGESRQESVKDGMDIAIICYNKKSGTLEYAGAKIDLLIYRNEKLEEVKADRISIGAGQKENILQKPFTLYQTQIQKNEIIYLFSDGFQDQFGGESDTKFMKNNFRSLLLETANLQINIQRSRLLKVLNRWQGDTIQNDDILVAGIKF